MTSSAASTPPQPNRLIHEKSPYLLQHAHNPVDWYPWGDEAFEKARREQKPVFLSIGYSTCHWCHVMERESFEQPAIAALLNRWFVSIKVDREEHPDLDQVYMQAVTAMTGQGGWPLTAFLTPDLQPFFGGTYFPPERRWDRPGMQELLPAVAEAWRTRREQLVTSAEQLTASLRQALAASPEPGALTPALLDAAFRQAVSAFDASWGGFGDAPKFPRSHELSFLLRYGRRTGEARALEMVTTTLDYVARGGIHDHLGGGFHRYSTDAQWLVPHFEKMLYDQALLARTYLDAYRMTQRPEYAQTARDIFTYVLRDLTDPQGGFWSAEDADSEGEEGAFYVWTPEQVVQALGPEEGERFNRCYGVTPEGNFSEGDGPRRTVLHLAQPSLAPQLASARATLLAARNRRVRPHRDDKILTSWNGLMIGALAYGASTLDEPRYAEAAARAASFILATMRAASPSAGGTSSPAGIVPARSRDVVLLRRYRDGEARYAGTLEDYAFLTHGLIELYEATGDPRWLGEAKTLSAQMLERFWDEPHGGFFFRGKDEAPLIVRSKEIYDGATPSGTSIAVLTLLQLGRLTADPAMESSARKTLEGAASWLERAPFSYPQMLSAADIALGPTQEIVIAGDPAAADTKALLRRVHGRFLPRAVVVLHPPGPAGAAVEALVPSVKAQGMVGGKATAYVCEHFVCQLPTTDPEKLNALLQR